VNVLEPAVVGVPERTPLDDPKVKPAGSVPVGTENTYGDIPPDAVIVVVYDNPTIPLGIVAGEIVTVAGLTVKVNCLVALSCANPGKAITNNAIDKNIERTFMTFSILFLEFVLLT
jgi:hypothetical protein